MSSDQWTAEDVKAALRRRHPATQSMGIRTVPGPWTCVEELLGCDLVAFAAHQRPAKGALRGKHYPRIGYEVKVSRSDYRAELRAPHKRERAVANCNEFYFAVPAGLLKPEERQHRNEPSETCLWVPPDVGLVEVNRAGSRVIIESPVTDAEPVNQALVAVIARHVSSHPDPRHVGVVEADRALCTELRAREREAKAQHKRDVEAWNRDMAAWERENEETEAA